MGLIGSQYLGIKFHADNLDHIVTQTLEFCAIFRLISDMAESVSSVGEQNIHV